ncbi:MAG: hypothetical protein ABW168_15150, partial [Sedimenticola sp.]
KNSSRKIIMPLRERLRSMLEKGNALVEGAHSQVVATAVDEMQHRYRSEIERLSALQRVNPNVRDEEIELLLSHRLALEEHLPATRVRLDALRMVVAV